jgi:hypothetical protein
MQSGGIELDHNAGVHGAKIHQMWQTEASLRDTGWPHMNVAHGDWCGISQERP